MSLLFLVRLTLLLFYLKFFLKIKSALFFTRTDTRVVVIVVTVQYISSQSLSKVYISERHRKYIC